MVNRKERIHIQVILLLTLFGMKAKTAVLIARIVKVANRFNLLSKYFIVIVRIQIPGKSVNAEAKM